MEQRATRNLVVVTALFTVSFWAWNVVAPLGTHYAELLDLSGSQKSLLVAMPVLVGSVGRIAAGALADLFGGRVMMPVLMLVAAPFVVLVAVAGNAESYGLLVAFGFFLGIAGTTFAVGIPFLNAWYEPSRRGFASGVFGAGMGGTALSAFFTPRFVDWFGYTATHVILAVTLVVAAALGWMLLTDAPTWKPSTEPFVPKIVAALKLGVTWQMSLLYAVTFGGFVAFSTYLPTYLTDIYDFDLTGAGSRTAGFAIAAVIARPVGGALSDRIGPKVVVLVSLAGAAVLAVVETFQPEPELAAGVSFVLLALFLGLGSGGVFAWVA
ncbi:MAG: MFS transporter, partial [Actinomycetia bacterium]|nr:MFS transporter [Actinomycetes bacterium]